VIRQKLDRAMEAATLTLRYAAGLRSKAAILSCYAAIVRDPTDPAEVSLDISLGAATFPVSMRKSDIFTLAEVLRERQYELDSPVPVAPFIVDGGSNIGLSAIWFLGRYPSARVHCFEPEPHNLRFLERNLGSRDDVVINAAAISKSAGRMTLHLADNSATHSIKDAPAGGATVDVQVVNLREYLDAHHVKRVDVLKLDVEGSEMDVIEGLGDRLSDVDVIVGELHERMVDGTAFYAYLEARGFRVLRRQKTHEAHVHMFEVARR
jgi:FkbM family methyltransferase